MKKDHGEPMKFQTNVDDDQDVPILTDLDPIEAAISKSLLTLAESIQPNSAFKKALEERLLALQETTRRVENRSFWESVSRFMLIWRSKMSTEKRFAYGLGLVAILLTGVLLVGPALAQFALPHFAPREVDEMPVLSAVTMAAAPEPITVDIVGRLEAQAGFAVLVPIYVPSDCHLSEGNYLPEPIGEVELVYRSSNNLPCFTTNQREIEDDITHTPFIYEGSGEEITIHGQPALYIDGMWVLGDLSDSEGNESDSGIMELGPGELAKLMETATWVEGPKQLIFENDTLLVRLDGGSQLSKEELIRIAESMK